METVNILLTRKNFDKLIPHLQKKFDARPSPKGPDHNNLKKGHVNLVVHLDGKSIQDLWTAITRAGK